MSRPLGRRTFLQGATAGAAALATPLGCRRAVTRFPQGVASGDPRSDGVLIWTRVETDDPTRGVPIRWEVATDDGFTDVVAEGDVVSSADADHTVRVWVDGLAPRTSSLRVDTSDAKDPNYGGVERRTRFEIPVDASEVRLT